ncbi:MAG: PKD domain-containing protein [Solirubrobacterales bacterium]
MAATLTLALAPSAAHADARLFITDDGGNRTAALDVSASGALTAVAGSPFGGHDGPAGIALTPDGKYAYVGNFDDGTVTAYSVFANGALVEVSGSPYPAGAGVIGVAVSPDGKFLYAADYNGDDIRGFAIGADGGLTALPGSPYATGGGPLGLAISPDGQHIYVSKYGTGQVASFTIGSDGSLTPLGSPISAGNTPVQVSITPDGSLLYTTDFFSNRLFGYAVAADGTLSALSGSPFSSPLAPIGTAISPDGKYLHVTGTGVLRTYAIGAGGGLTDVPGSPLAVAQNVESPAVSPDGRFVYSSTRQPVATGYSVGPDGSLSALSGSPFATGLSFSYLQSIAFQPDRGPTAAFTSPGSFSTGSPVSFDASSSTDPDGTIARYDWDFGDGTTLADGGPTPSHTYATAGTYDVKLTVSDDAGCSTTIVFTGQTASCNGSSAATVTHSISDPAPVVTDLAVTPKRFPASGGDTPANGKRRGAEIDLTLSEDARVRFRIRQDPQRRDGGPPPRRLRKFNRNLDSGAGSVPFTGTLGKKTFKPGRYVVIARAVDSANQRSERVTAKFAITAP